MSKSPITTVSLTLNIILLIGLGYLYYLHFSVKDNPLESSRKTPEAPALKNLTRIAYINSDSILSHYKLAIEKSRSLESKGKRLEAEIRTKQGQYEKDAVYFQQQVQAQSISEESAQEIYSQLMQEQQKIIEMQELYSTELAREELGINLMLIDSLSGFLQRLNRSNYYDYVLGYTKGGNIFLTNERFNITDVVIEGLNKEYDEKYDKN
ncbi:MAG: OmpH family outer membrane protein [Bacteroidales bacterium]|nr:OmpH family outer membrane protein [Bacteroidales bacterium]